MTLITGLLSNLWPYIALAGGALLALWQYGRTQKKAGVNEQIAKEAKARDENLKRIKAAADAGNRPPDIVSDPHNRDNR